MLGRGPALLVFCEPQICQKCVGGRNSARGPRTSRRSSTPPRLVGWGGGHSSQSPPLSAPSVLSFCAPQCNNKKAINGHTHRPTDKNTSIFCMPLAWPVMNKIVFQSKAEHPRTGYRHGFCPCDLDLDWTSLMYCMNLTWIF